MNQKIFYLQIQPESFQISIQRLLEILLPKYKFEFLNDDLCIQDISLLKLNLIESSFNNKEPLVTELTFVEGDQVYTDRRSHTEILDFRYEEFDYQRRGKDLIKNHIYTFLVNFLNEKMSPWGILTGIRPTKILHYLRDKKFSFEEIEGILREVYVISDEKIDLLLRIGKIEERYLPTREDANKRVSIYIGIPFCPSRCRYCSFPSFSVQKHNRFIKPFLNTLLTEVEEIGSFIKEHGLQVDSIYLGGGTPTSLSTSQMEALLRHVEKHISVDNLLEYNVEAGRPDTITLDKLRVLKNCGVTRISINPQTMQQKTLDTIGRDHTVEKIIEVFGYAREVGFENINMDLIIGLPGEDFQDVQSTIEQIFTLRPDSVTIHTLSLKKASSWWETAGDLPFPPDYEVTRMLEYVDQVLQENQLYPYYMYRQKYILGNQENVGYSISGKESIYNMIMIDERETVIGLGGGAVTKVVNPKDWSLSRYKNPKYPGDYIDNINQILEAKLSLLTSFQ
ncbi:MAG: coproporphyrinogen dehydrogenase HemZ [Halanaerobiales bacterium]|nr:coproporphyrinogen dehydrogenase HemZ [Halanaerobiales bacterium]